MKTCLDVTYSCHGTPGNPRGHFGDIFSSGLAMQARRYCTPRDVTTFGFVCFSRTEAASAPVTSSSDLSDVTLLYPVVEFAIILLLRNWLVHIAMLFCVFCLILFKDMMQNLAYCKSSHFCMLQTGDVYSACHQRLYMSYIFIHFHLDYLFNQAVGIKGAVCSEETNRQRSP